ncbi:hypothetical protein TRIATDRAFT_315502 [Trichoderma atroviride IMI 206040]|uniref:Uncharacterized protein n=1 Tax=Hypocrea atroviridis (strain ATCC 20476 / IMI 206040) TaxID=452589 RepID=G9NJT7_HYPAI|nr:uncharacterized protein TRIATDRAFT_315502 [Trichoderma atroviride IMI 206040]EHK49160.1 hypothetical protein TRIATDRAFT_315502 [Trichoderma atroviride IMI 206040]
MDFDETGNSLYLAGSGWVTDIYDTRSGPMTTNPMAAGFAPTCPPYNGGEYLASPEQVYEPRRRLYSDEYDHQFPNPEYYNAPSHFSTREIADDSFFDAAFVSSQALQVPSPSLALIDYLRPEPIPFEGYGSGDWDSEHIAQLRCGSDTLPLYSNTDNFDYGCSAPGTNYPTNGIDGDGLLDSLYPSETALQPVAEASAAGVIAPLQNTIYQGSLSEFMAKSETTPVSLGQPAPFAMQRGSSRQPVPTSMLSQQPDYAVISSPYTVISPPSSTRSSPRKRSASAARIDKSPVGPKKRVIKAHMLAKVDNIEDSKLKIETDKLPTFEYQEYFHSPADANTKLRRLLELFRKSEDNCSNPSTDSTFPQSNEDKKRYVGKLFNAINDWENINEWSQTLVPEERNRVIDEHRRMKEEANGATPDKKPNDIPLDEMRPSRDELPTLDVQQKKILGRQLNDQTVEWLCWELIEAAIQSQQGYTQIPYWCGADGA